MFFPYSNIIIHRNKWKNYGSAYYLQRFGKEMGDYFCPCIILHLIPIGLCCSYINSAIFSNYVLHTVTCFRFYYVSCWCGVCRPERNASWTPSTPNWSRNSSWNIWRPNYFKISIQTEMATNRTLCKLTSGRGTQERFPSWNLLLIYNFKIINYKMFRAKLIREIMRFMETSSIIPCHKFVVNETFIDSLSHSHL